MTTSASAAFADMNKPTVLFVDDEQDVLEGIRDVMRREPYRLLTANSGPEALEVLARQRVDIVISDERMPGMQGSELLGEVRRKYPNTIRIVLTGQASMEATIRAINDGQVFRFLTKPFAPKDLAACIREAIEAHANMAPPPTPDAENIEERKKARALNGLEARHPGISKLERTASGAIVIDMDDF